eukprot:m.191071 g.191071  ORF g.191071 m.191071 type:complete len:1646 (-) comp14834_c0_seq1:294-5231(-)
MAQQRLPNALIETACVVGPDWQALVQEAALYGGIQTFIDERGVLSFPQSTEARQLPCFRKCLIDLQAEKTLKDTRTLASQVTWRNEIVYPNLSYNGRSEEVILSIVALVQSTSDTIEVAKARTDTIYSHQPWSCRDPIAPHILTFTLRQAGFHVVCATYHQHMDLSTLQTRDAPPPSPSHRSPVRFRIASEGCSDIDDDVDDETDRSRDVGSAEAKHKVLAPVTLCLLTSSDNLGATTNLARLMLAQAQKLNATVSELSEIAHHGMWMLLPPAGSFGIKYLTHEHELVVKPAPIHGLPILDFPIAPYLSLFGDDLVTIFNYLFFPSKIFVVSKDPAQLLPFIQFLLSTIAPLRFEGAVDSLLSREKVEGMVTSPCFNGVVVGVLQEHYNEFKSQHDDEPGLVVFLDKGIVEKTMAHEQDTSVPPLPEYVSSNLMTLLRLCRSMNYDSSSWGCPAVNAEHDRQLRDAFNDKVDWQIRRSFLDAMVKLLRKVRQFIEPGPQPHFRVGAFLEQHADEAAIFFHRLHATVAFKSFAQTRCQRPDFFDALCSDFPDVPPCDYITVPLTELRHHPRYSQPPPPALTTSVIASTRSPTSDYQQQALQMQQQQEPVQRPLFRERVSSASRLLMRDAGSPLALFPTNTVDAAFSLPSSPASKPAGSAASGLQQDIAGTHYSTRFNTHMVNVPTSPISPNSATSATSPASVLDMVISPTSTKPVHRYGSASSINETPTTTAKKNGTIATKQDLAQAAAAASSATQQSFGSSNDALEVPHAPVEIDQGSIGTKQGMPSTFQGPSTSSRPHLATVAALKRRGNSSKQLYAANPTSRPRTMSLSSLETLDLSSSSPSGPSALIRFCRNMLAVVSAPQLIPIAAKQVHLQRALLYLQMALYFALGDAPKGVEHLVRLAKLHDSLSLSTDKQHYRLDFPVEEVTQMMMQLDPLTRISNLRTRSTNPDLQEIFQRVKQRTMSSTEPDADESPAYPATGPTVTDELLLNVRNPISLDDFRLIACGEYKRCSYPSAPRLFHALVAIERMIHDANDPANTSEGGWMRRKGSMTRASPTRAERAASSASLSSSHSSSSASGDHLSQILLQPKTFTAFFHAKKPALKSLPPKMHLKPQEILLLTPELAKKSRKTWSFMAVTSKRILLVRAKDETEIVDVPFVNIIQIEENAKHNDTLTLHTSFSDVAAAPAQAVQVEVMKLFTADAYSLRFYLTELLNAAKTTFKLEHQRAAENIQLLQTVEQVAAELCPEKPIPFAELIECIEILEVLSHVFDTQPHRPLSIREQGARQFEFEPSHDMDTGTMSVDGLAVINELLACALANGSLALYSLRFQDTKRRFKLSGRCAALTSFNNLLWCSLETGVVEACAISNTNYIQHRLQLKGDVITAFAPFGPHALFAGTASGSLLCWVPKYSTEEFLHVVRYVDPSGRVRPLTSLTIVGKMVWCSFKDAIVVYDCSSFLDKYVGSAAHVEWFVASCTPEMETVDDGSHSVIPRHVIKLKGSWTVHAAHTAKQSDSQVWCCGQTSGELYIFNACTLQQCQYGGHMLVETDGFTALAVTRNYVWAAANSNTLFVFEKESHTYVVDLTIHTDRIRSMMVIDYDKDTIATGAASLDGRVIVWKWSSHSASLVRSTSSLSTSSATAVIL